MRARLKHSNGIAHDGGDVVRLFLVHGRDYAHPARTSQTQPTAIDAHRRPPLDAILVSPLMAACLPISSQLFSHPARPLSLLSLLSAFRFWHSLSLIACKE